MTTSEIAKDFTDLCKAGKFDEAGATYWAEDVVSLEPMTGDMAVAKGRAAVGQKGVWWYANHEIHDVSVEGPFTHGDQFTVIFAMDVTPKTGPMEGKRMAMREVGLYTLRDGKIVEERFFYGG